MGRVHRGTPGTGHGTDVVPFVQTAARDHAIPACVAWTLPLDTVAAHAWLDSPETERETGAAVCRTRRRVAIVHVSPERNVTTHHLGIGAGRVPRVRNMTCINRLCKL